MNQQTSRRKFLGQIGCTALTALPFYSTWLSLSKMSAAATASAQPPEDYRALVCILLSGGNDSFNMLVPRGSTEYQTYARTRSNLALPQNSLLALPTQLQTGLELGVHPAMTEMRQLYQEGQLAFIANIGTLVEPTTREQFDQETVRLPEGLYSHADQMMQWQTSVPQDRSAIGWGGKMADLLGHLNSNQQISMNISLSGNNVFQAGRQTVEYSITPEGGARMLYGYHQDGLVARIRSRAVDSMLEQEYESIFSRTYMNTVRTGMRANEQFSLALQQTPTFADTFSANEFSASLRMIARTIAARESLGMRRQVFFINFGDWDHHDEVINIHNEMMGVVSRGLLEFQTAINQLGVADQVTTFNISDFGRTLTSNGNGSDHGWGGNVFVMGGAVHGGEVYGRYPDLGLNTLLDVGGGVYIPTTSTDEYFAELALWMGVSSNDLPLVLPNIGNFYSPSSEHAPIGFLHL